MRDFHLDVDFSNDRIVIVASVVVSAAGVVVVVAAQLVFFFVVVRGWIGGVNGFDFFASLDGIFIDITRRLLLVIAGRGVLIIVIVVIVISFSTIVNDGILPGQVDAGHHQIILLPRGMRPQKQLVLLRHILQHSAQPWPRPCSRR